MPVRYSEESLGPDTRRAHAQGAEESEAEEKSEIEEEPVAVAEIEATDAAADLAQELGIDLASVKGTGKNGKITVGDVRAAAEDA